MSMRTISALCGVLIAIATLVASASVSLAENWPTRSIKIIVPFAAGGAVDLVARFLQTDMGKALGTTMFVDDRPGGAGVPASEVLIHSPPDGYTVALVSSNYASNAVLQPHLSYNTIKDITPISMAVINTVLILVPANSSIHTLSDLVAQAKAKPGALSYGTPGFGTAMHFAGEMLRSRANINITHVPYHGAAPALNDLLGHQIPTAIMGIGPALPYIRIRQVAGYRHHHRQAFQVSSRRADRGGSGLSGFQLRRMVRDDCAEGLGARCGHEAPRRPRQGN